MITEEIKIYNEEHLLEIAEDKVKELYQELKGAIISLGSDVEVRRNKEFVGIVVLTSKLKPISVLMYLNS